MKKCSLCKTKKSLSEYYRGSNPDGHDNYCKNCRLSLNKLRDLSQDSELRRAYDRGYKARKNIEARMGRVHRACKELQEKNFAVTLSNVALRSRLKEETIKRYPELMTIIELERE